ncbi:hypothetical protein [Pedobacter punctiformis]|uniref:Uncharacterized protein n=1 Tax=Pedobacter punctiformis TaxID=3004097 RepID=A0ABT4LAM9_9SPHI|nr:hypothetical protein [Pedobacter sp. HCMS5-2]MCZ4244916.1 hypothetical protein [Pedobacter sp. HCMS5-2]
MPLTILYIGRDAEITTVMHRLLNERPEWTGLTVCNDDEAVSICKKQQLDLVLLGNGINAECEATLRQKLTSIRPGLKIIQHYGGGSGLLYGEIMSAIN